MVALRRVKERLKSTTAKNKKKTIVKGKTAVLKKEEKRELLGTHETVVVGTKFFTPEPQKPRRPVMEELPLGYHEDKIVLQVRDPRWIHSYWEMRPQTLEVLRQRLGDAFDSAKMVLRVYDVSYIIFDGKNANSFFDLEINPEASSWYIDTKGPGKSWCVDLGLKLASGEFITIIRSNTVHTPIEGPSWITDEEWMVPDDIFARLYGLGFGLGQSSPVGKAWQERVKKVLFSGALSSGASPVKKPLKEKNFWLVVNTELIVYGATEADAKVTVQDKPVDLRADGTFSLRFALPDGKQVIPVKAVAADGREKRIVTPVVNKETK